jgi:phosphate butyryltransferase
MPPIKNYAEMLAAASQAGPVPVAIAAAEEYEILVTASEAQAKGIIHAILVGNEGQIRAIADQHHVDLTGMDMRGEPDSSLAADMTMRLVSQGAAKVAIKGRMQTSTFLHAALRREVGLRTDRLLSHVGIFEIPGFDRLLFITDGGVVLFPTREQKEQIISNAIPVARGLGITEPRVAILAASDEASDDLPETREIEAIVAMQDRWRDEGAWVDGPFMLDTAVSEEIARINGRSGPVAGHADVLVAPDIQSGNIMAKGITYFAHGRMAGLVVGARAPLVVGSRADPPETRLVCIAAGALLAATVSRSN